MAEKKCNTVSAGDVFGELTVLEEDFEKEKEKKADGNHHKFFKCKCSCGEIASVDVYQLLRGMTRSCGHLKKVRARGVTAKKLDGMKFHHLTAIRMDDSKESKIGKHVYWICKCDLCENEKSIRSSDLISGYAKDCGCQFIKRVSDSMTQDLNGRKFGHLDVLERDMSIGHKSGQHARWVCKCDLCGNIESVASTTLLKRGKDRCKLCAGVSMGEQKICEILDGDNISYVHDKPYLNCKYPETGGTLRFDFRINKDSDCDYIIEFDGEQHFKPVPMYDDGHSFQERVKRDQFKNDWCKENGIPLIRIPYRRLAKLNINDLLLETTEYLVA